MKKQSIIYILIIIIGISIFIYLFLFYLPDNFTAKEDFILYENKTINIEPGVWISEFLDSDLNDKNFDLNYNYRQNARNPFKLENDEKENVEISDATAEEEEIENEKKDENKLTVADVKEKISFKLTGIIEIGNIKIAVIKENNDSYFLRKGDKYGDFKIYEIQNKKILIQYDDIMVDLKISN